MASLEGAKAGLTLITGIAAITTASLSHWKAGDSVIVDQVVYGCSFAFVARDLRDLRVETVFAEMTDLNEAARLFINALELIESAVSLGTEETLAQHPVTKTHAIYKPEIRADQSQWPAQSSIQAALSLLKMS